FFVHPELRARVIKRLEPLTVVPFQMDNTGSQIVVYQPTEPVQTQAARSLQLAA
ncbi:MAG: hypothetical protein JO318_17095, partial [Chloroflexi bacterium]|nr:hypothetical protein [Chloroflexota bacterium]